MSLFEIVAEFFSTGGWDVEPVEGICALRGQHTGRSGQWTIYAQIREPQGRFVFYSLCPVWVPEARRLAVAEFITRANYGMLIGNFELDFVDGEVRFKTGIDVEGDRLSGALVAQVVGPNLAMMDRYLGGIMAVVFASETPVKAISNIESH